MLDNLSPCLFCENELHERVFMQSACFKAFYNIAPILPGHTLIVPKRHIEKIVELPAQESSELFPFIQQVIAVLTYVFNTHDFDLSLQDGAAAGQTVNHLHVHLIPRTKGDLPDAGDWYNELYNDNILLDSNMRTKLSDEQLINITDKLKKAAEYVLKIK